MDETMDLQWTRQWASTYQFLSRQRDLGGDGWDGWEWVGGKKNRQVRGRERKKGEDMKRKI